MVVGEGVMTTLSASARFSLPGWALLSAGNLCRWTSPERVRRVIVAADRGPAGEAAAVRLCRRLRAQGVAASMRQPPTHRQQGLVMPTPARINFWAGFHYHPICRICAPIAGRNLANAPPFLLRPDRDPEIRPFGVARDNP